MLALILAGGRGGRLGLGEKPLVTLCGSPMIAYVIDAFACAGHEPFVVASPACPLTANWCRAQHIGLYTAKGMGYVEDLVEAGCALDAAGPLFTCVSDLPLITPGIITHIEKEYRNAETPACSVWIPVTLCHAPDHRADYTDVVLGTSAVPVGINILRGDRITAPQEEVRVLSRDTRLGYNVNTRKDLACVRRVLCPAEGRQGYGNLPGK